MKERVLLDKFIQEYYPELNKKILKQMIIQFNENLLITKNQLYADLEEFLKLVEVNKSSEVNLISNIAISVPYIDLCNDNPTYTFEIYNEAPFINEAAFYKSFPIPWRIINWSEQINVLFESVINNKMQMYIKKHCIEAMHRKSIRRYLILISYILKKLIKDIETQSFYNEIKKADTFTITFGEYYDWQNIIFREKKSIDIFGEEKETNFSYMKFSDLTYENKSFKALNLNEAVFYNCKFINCEFINTTLYNTEFINCKFKNCKFKEVKLYGSLFQSSSMNDIEMIDIKSNCLNEKIEDFELCSELKFLASHLENISFIDSDLTFVKILESSFKKLESYNSKISSTIENIVINMEE